jgi:hypothetical protein
LKLEQDFSARAFLRLEQKKHRTQWFGVFDFGRLRFWSFKSGDDGCVDYRPSSRGRQVVHLLHQQSQGELEGVRRVEHLELGLHCLRVDLFERGCD